MTKLVKTQSKGMVTIPIEFRRKLGIANESLLEARLVKNGVLFVKVDPRPDFDLYSDEEIEASVGHMLKAFSYGAPPHGGIGMGVERTIMNLTGETYLREVQAFPMTGSGNTAVMDAPSTIDDAVLSEYHLNVSKKKT